MIPFTGNPLDRRSDKRGDASWLTGQWQSAVVYPLWRLNVLVTGTPLLAAGAVSRDLAETLAPPDAPWVFLGLDGETPVFALDVSETSDAPEALKPYGEFLELRAAAPSLRRKDLAILSQAKAMIDWHARHRFCARCGAPTVIADAGYKRACPRCQAEHFPRTDPAVIMLATYGDKCLLARNVSWSADFYSCLAGFMEPGETIEEAVARELYEEVGLRAKTVRYAASQPWPFPAALMLGCYVEVESMELRLDPAEIADAEWYTKEEARALLAGEIEGRRGAIKIAIAYHLIKAWLEG